MTNAEPEDDLAEDENGEEEPEENGEAEHVEITLTQLIQYIAEALVGSAFVIIGEVLADDVVKVFMAEADEMIERFGLDALNKTFDVGV